MRIPHVVQRSVVVLAAISLVAITRPGLAAAPDPDAKALAREILKATGVKGGLIVHLGCGDGRLTEALRVNDSYQVQGLDRSAQKIEAARETIKKNGRYGPVAVEQLFGNLMPYIDNLVNLAVVEDPSGIPMNEITRALAPRGVAYVKQGNTWQKTVKPVPSDIDDWTHYYYDARGNATSKDLEVGPPERMQWVGSPRWSRHHDRMSSLSAQVSANGRMYYIMDEGSRISILLPSKWNLIARDAFNGTILWKQSIARWHDHLWPLKSGPTQLARRLVAHGDVVYVTLGIGEPIVCLDGATGKTLRTYDGTAGTEEILLINGVIYALVNPDRWALDEFAPKHNTGDQRRVETEFNWDEKVRRLVAVDAASGKVLWEKESKIAPLTMAADGKRVVYYDGQSMVCLEAAKGERQWASEPLKKRQLFEYNYAPRLLIHKDTVLYAGGDGAMKGLNANTGKELWSAPHQKSGYRSPEDLIVAGGLVWNAPTISGGMSGIFTGRDPVTGEVKSEFPPTVETYWFHHRCYIAKATERFLIPSRTGIEYVDFNKKTWDINHWVRAACLYGSMPCNGLTYAGPHNCACYPEAKLDGLNAMGAGTYSPHPAVKPDAERLEKGPAFGQPLKETEADAKDWPTYRHDNARSGYSNQELVDDLDKAWDVKLSGPLSALTIAAGKTFVSQIDQHTLHALDAKTGKPVWHFIAGARVDSPPTYWKGRLLFGCKDGWVYCLRAEDGKLIWRFNAAGRDRRHGAFEQVESVWPVHGSVLVQDGVVHCVAGRSVFLDGGLRFLRLDAATGKKLVETVFDDKDPETGRDLQERTKTLQMPVGLNDILSYDGKHVYLRSQKIDPKSGLRVDIGPVSGNAAEQGGAQRGDGSHIFAPMGFLDDTWFHRSYWVYGKSFAGGHNGYYQAGKYTPAGRILVFDEKNVYGFGRLPQYYKWTTTMEHQMFSASKEAPDVKVDPASTAGKKKQGKNKTGKAQAPVEAPKLPMVRFDDSDKLDPSKKPLTVMAWVQPAGKDGVIVSYGGGQMGYALTLQDGAPAFTVRAEKQEVTAAAARPLSAGWHHLAGVLTSDEQILIFVDGEVAAQARAAGMIAQKPKLGLQIGACGSSLVTSHGGGAPYTGLPDQFMLFHKALEVDQIVKVAGQPGTPIKDGLVIACLFDNGDARDDSGNRLNGIMAGIDFDKGKMGTAMSFGKATPPPAQAPAVANASTGKKGSVTALPAAATATAGAGSFVKHDWNRQVPIFTRAMAMAGKRVFISGPPDKIDEEYAFERLTFKDNDMKEQLAEQDAALDGKRGALLWSMATDSGKTGSEIDLQSPPVWDGMAVAQGRLYVATQDGKIICFGKAKE